MPNVTGQFKNIGYKLITLQNPKNENRVEEVSVFYPTQEMYSIKRDVKWITQDDFYQPVFEFLNSPFFSKRFNFNIPKFLFKFEFSFLKSYALGIVKNAQLIFQKNEKTTFKIAIFSHGLSMHRHAYSTYTKQLASQGYIVFALDHLDPVDIKNLQKPKELVNLEQQHQYVRNKQLIKRFNSIQNLLDNLDNKGYLAKLFDINDNLKKNVKFETDNICLIGHSFGGGTAIYTAMNENRIKSIVALDPWLFPINKQDLQDLPIKQPILIINSENFYTLCLKMDQKQKMDIFIQTQKNKQTLDNKQMIMLKGTGHTNQCDMIFPTSVQSKIAMKYQVGDLNLILQFHRLQIKCIEIFLQENNQCIIQTSKDDRNIKLNIRKQIDDYSKQNKMDKFLLYEVE